MALRLKPTRLPAIEDPVYTPPRWNRRFRNFIESCAHDDGSGLDLERFPGLIWGPPFSSISQRRRRYQWIARESLHLWLGVLPLESLVVSYVTLTEY